MRFDGLSGKKLRYSDIREGYSLKEGIIALNRENGLLQTKVAPSYYTRFNTGKGDILPCVGCDPGNTFISSPVEILSRYLGYRERSERELKCRVE